MIVAFPSDMDFISFLLGIAIFYFAFIRPITKTPEYKYPKQVKKEIGKNKFNELKEIVERKNSGETIYLDDLKYLDREDLKKYLNARFSDEK